jgi:hypothetical protein
MKSTICWVAIVQYKSTRGSEECFTTVKERGGLNHTTWSYNPEDHTLLYKLKLKLRGFGPRANYADRATAACWQSSANFCGWCCVVSATDSHGRYSRFSRPEPLLFLPSSSSVVLMRLSGPRSRPTASQKIWKCRESNPGNLDL